ncbi:MAG: nitroreductase [Thermodesulfovibrionales bacterium]|nr:nitroreductase [Thermodesulfovibrionales bacterium]
MEAIECIKTRMSIRKFRPGPVPKNILTEIINTAQCSPSYKNSQPWEVVIVSGKKKEELSALLVRLLEEGKAPQPDIPEAVSWPSDIAERINETMKERGALLGIDLNSPDIKKKSKAANFRFYGAPHGIFLFQDSSLNAWSIFDAGLFAQSLMLAARAHGIGTVPQAFLTDYSLEVKQFLGIPESKRLVLGISIGYPDMENPINTYRTARVETDKILRWVE